MADSYKLNGQPWQNRIVGHEIVDPEQLLANPMNARVHGKLQQDATAGNLNDIGWVKSVVVNTTTGHVIDGHLRITLAMRKGELVPVEYVELSEAEEKQALATLDPLTNLATYDDELLDALLREVNTGDEALQQMLVGLATDAGLYETIDPNAEWQGMPTFQHEDKTAFKTIHVHFANLEDLSAFADLVGQNITEATKFIWYPKQERILYGEAHES